MKIAVHQRTVWGKSWPFFRPVPGGATLPR